MKGIEQNSLFSVGVEQAVLRGSTAACGQNHVGGRGETLGNGLDEAPRSGSLPPHRADAEPSLTPRQRREQRLAVLKFAQQMGVNLFLADMGHEESTHDMASRIGDLIQNKYAGSMHHVVFITDNAGYDLGFHTDMKDLSIKEFRRLVAPLRAALDALEIELLQPR